ncbi:MAG TPA: PAS domain-containing protein, partial [Flavisolibacter sp.]|nr:PAS domain-containing protein [Flavisolibacter sp.]
GFIYNDDRKKFNDELELILKEKRESSFEFRMLALGVIKFVKASFRLITYERREYFIATIQDISKEYLLQERLRERVQLAESLSESIRDSIIITDYNNNIIFLNDQFEEMFKIKKEQAIQNNFYEMLPFFKSDQIIDSLGKAQKGEKIFLANVELPFRRGNYNLSMRPLKNDEEQVNSILLVVHDVSKEFQLQQNQAERLSFIEGIVDASVDRIIALDRNMNYVTWNKKCEDHYGLKREEMLGRNVLEIFPQSANGPTYDDFRKALRGETVYIPPSDIPSVSTYEEVYLIPVKNHRNEVTAVLWMLHDLSKEHELRKLQTRAGEFMEAINENYFELDNQYRLIYINVRGEEFFASKKEELIGKIIWEIFPNAIETSVYDAIVKAMENRESAKGEFLSLAKGIYIFASVIPTSDGVAVIFLDIKRIKENEQKLEQSLEQWKTLVNNTPDAITRWDDNFNLIFANDAYASKAGIDLPDLAGKNIFEAGISKKSIAALTKKIKEVFEYGQDREHFDYYHSVDGDVYLYSKLVPEYGSDGKVHTVLSISRDITELTKMQSILGSANEQLTMQNNIYEFAEEIAKMGTWTWKPDTNEAHFSNNMFYLFGIAPNSLKPGFDTIPKFIHPEDRNKMLGLAAELKDGFEPKDVEYKVIAGDGSLKFFRNKCKMHFNEKRERICIGI